MESFDAARFGCIGFAVRKKRSNASRQHCSDLWKFSCIYNFQPLSAESSICGRKENGYFKERTVGSHGLGSENRPKKLKLKLGGVTHSINTQSDPEYAFSGGLTTSKSSQCFDSSQHRQNAQLQDAAFGKNSSVRGKPADESLFVNKTYKYDPVRKIKRVHKRRVMDVAFNEEDDDADEELCYLERLNASKSYADYEDDKNERSRKTQIVLKLSGCRQKDDEAYLDDVNKPGYRIKKLKYVERVNESSPTTRNRSLQSGKGVGLGERFIEFPNGLLPAPSKRQKSTLSEVEQQLKKAAAAQRRRLQSEKAAKEAEVEAIRKILGQNSARKKEEKMRRQRDELAQERAAKRDMLGSNTVRLVMGPTGTVVSFSDDIGLPHIFNSTPCRYPPPREQCGGPNCTNAYKYRDSKTKVPLCSLNCYRAIHGKKM